MRPIGRRKSTKMILPFVSTQPYSVKERDSPWLGGERAVYIPGNNVRRVQLNSLSIRNCAPATTSIKPSSTITWHNVPSSTTKTISSSINSFAAVRWSSISYEWKAYDKTFLLVCRWGPTDLVRAIYCIRKTRILDKCITFNIFSSWHNIF